MAKSVLEQIQEYKNSIQQEKTQAAQIRQEAKSAGTWGKQQNSTLNYTAPKVVVPEEKKTAVDKLWDRGSDSSYSKKADLKSERDRTKKELDDYLNSDARKKTFADAQKKYQQDQLMRQLTTGILDMPAPAMQEDPVEKKLRDAAQKAERAYQYEEQRRQTAKDQKTMETDLEELATWSDEDRIALEKYAVGKNVDYFDSLNMAQNGMQIGRAEQQAAGLIQKYGQKRVDELAETWNRSQNKKTTEEVATMAQEGAGSGLLGAVGHSAGSVAAGAVGGIGGVLDYIRELSQRSGRYTTLDPNAAGNLGNVYSSAVRGTVAQNIEEGNGLLGKAGSIAYQGVMSMADTIARGYLGGGAFGGAALAATNTFSQTMADAAKQGASPGQAALLATSNAAIEALSEKIPLDNLISTAKGGTQTVKQIVKTALAQAGIEATTEEISLVGNLLAEAAILQEKSSYNQTVNELVANGATPAEAKQKAAMNIWNEAVNTALVSAVSGGLSSAGASVVANMGTAPETAQPQVTEAERIKQNVLNAVKPKEVVQETTQNPLPVPQTVETAQQERISAQEETQEQHHQEDLGQDTGTRPKDIQDNSAQSQQDPINMSEEEFLNSMGDNKNAAEADPFSDRNWHDVGKRSEKAFMHDNPEVKELFQMEAYHMLNELNNSTRGERGFNEDVFYDSGGESGWYGTKRHTSDGIAELLDNGLTYEQIEAGLNAIIKDGGSENNAASKRIEFIINDRLLNGRKDFFTGENVPPSPDYINYVSQNSARSVDTQEQSTVGGQHKIKGTGAAEQNFTGTAAYDDLLSDDNVQRSRKGDVRNVEVPKTDTDGKVVSEFVSNSMNSALTPDRFTDTIKKLVVDGKVSHDVQSNEESLRMAAAEIAKDGTIYSSVQKVKEVAKSGKTSVTDVAKAELLYNHLVQQEDQHSQEMAADVYVTLAQLATNSGRSTQMFSLFRKMTPDGQVMALEQEVKRNVEQMKKQGKVKKDYDPQIHPEVLAEYRKAAVANKNAKTPEAQQETAEQLSLWQDAIYANEAAKMPATFKAKWDAWRYMAMLGNVKTQARNIVGNLAFKPYKAVKDTMAAGFERVFIKQDQRTKSVLTLSANDRALTEWAKADTKSKDVQNALKYSAKLGDDVTSSVMSDNQTVFKSKALEETRKFIEKVPAAGDMLFKNGYYEKSIAGFLKARGYTAADIQNGNVSDTVLNEGRAYAIQEAMKATFNDCNAFSDAVASIGRASGIIHKDNAWSKALNIAAEGVLPFRRTPANIVVRFTEYSPVGLAKGVWDAATKIRSGQISAAAAVDQLAAGMTGTAAMALGFMLAKGIGGVKITGSGTDEDEKRQGHQDYAVEFSIDGQEYSYKIDWAAPANLPLFVGANIYSALENAGADTDVSKLTSFIHGMGTMFEPMLALSCMSSLNDLVEGVRYADEGEALYTMASQMATSYFTQGIPALARQTAQAVQENKQTTFANSEDPTIRDIQKTAANIPFAGSEFQMDKVNAWGEKESNGNGFWRWFNAFVNPGTGKKIDNSALEQEINRLNESQTESVTPPTASKTITFTDKDGNVHDGERLTEEQYLTLATTQGQTAKRILETMFSSKDYAAMTDEQKAKAVNQVYVYARKTGEIAAIGDNHTGYSDSWMVGIENKEAKEIMRRVMNSELNSAMSNLDTAWDKGYNEDTFSRELQTAYDSYSKLTSAAKKEVKEFATGTTGKYIEARDKGISHEDFVSAAERIAKVKGTGSNGTVRDIDRRRAIANTTGLTEKEVDIIMKCYMGDYDPSDESPEKTELKYDYVRRELGLSARAYVDTYRAHLDNSKKADKIAAIMDLGYDRKTANALYKVYAGQTNVVKWYEAQ